MSRIDYPLIYPDLRKNETEPSGGYVEMHVTHASQEAGENIETAIILARLGFKVRLMPITNIPDVKNPDAVGVVLCLNSNTIQRQQHRLLRMR